VSAKLSCRCPELTENGGSFTRRECSARGLSGSGIAARTTVLLGGRSTGVRVSCGLWRDLPKCFTRFRLTLCWTASELSIATPGLAWLVLKTSSPAFEKGLYLLLVSLAIGLIACDVVSRFALVEAATRVETSDTPIGSRAASFGDRQRVTVLPSTALDARWWVIHAERGLREGRIRFTSQDNSPSGREVHWSSGPVWLLGVIARTMALFSGNPPLEEVQRAPLWFGPVAFLMLVIVVTLLIAPRFGWGYAGFLILLYAASLPVYEAFRAGDADHHGLTMIFALGCVLGLVCGGVGWSVKGKSSASGNGRPAPIPSIADARKYFIMSAMSGAAGMWVSAATMIPVLAGCGLGAVAAAWLKPEARATANPAFWRLWGFWGAVGSVGFYLLEYFPENMGWRLEANHPLYALAWLAGGEVLSRTAGKISGGPFMGRGLSDILLCLSALAGIFLVPAIVILNRSSWLLISDPFLVALHKEHIREFAPLWEFVCWKGSLPDIFAYLAWPVFALASLAVALFIARPGKSWHPVLAFSFACAGTIEILALFQVRWSGLAIALWSVCILILLVILSERPCRDRVPNWILALLGAWGLAALLAFPYWSVPASFHAGDVSKNLPQSLVPSILLRDIARRLVEANPRRIPIVLSDPTSSTDLAYYGGIPTIGTLYWENLEGLKRAAAIFSAPTGEGAHSLLLEAGVTHIVLPSWDDFADLSAYGRLLGIADPSYLQGVLDGTVHPAWLREYPYPIPDGFGIPDETVRVFEVLP